MKNLAEEVAEALDGVIPQDCPIKDEPAETAKTFPLPDDARKLIPIWHRLQKKSVSLITNGSSGHDGGVWLRHHDEEEALRVFIDNIIRTERGLSYRHRFDWFSGWRYTDDGGV